MIVLQALLLAGVGRADIRTYPLDARCVYTVRLAKDRPTTCVFPGPIKGLVGANISTKTEDTPGILLSHETGADYFSLRALKADATGALNVMFRGQVYAFAFVTGGQPDQAVVLLDDPVTGGGRRTLAAETLRELLERAKQYDRLRALYPAMVPAIDRSQPGTPTFYLGYTATVLEVARFDAEDVLVLRIRLETTEDRAITYDPKGLAIRVGREIYPAAYCEATGAIPAKGTSEAYLVVAGIPGHGRANLSVRETFNVLVPRL